MSRHRGAKHRRRYELLGGISLLSRSTFYPLSDGPSIQNHRITMTCFRTCSRRHARSQASLCHCTNLLMSDRLANLRAPPLRFGRRPPQSNYPPDTVRNPVRANVRTSNIKGWYFKVGSTQTGVHASKPPTYPTSRLNVQCQAIVKVHGSFRLAAGTLHLHSEFNFTESRVETAGHHYAIRAGRNLPTRNFATLGPL